MVDMEKVMSWLEGLTQQDWRMFHSDSEVQEIARNAIALLKEQDAVKIHITDYFGSIKFGHCPNCGANINSKAFQKSCGCGQAVKWE